MVDSRPIYAPTMASLILAVQEAPVCPQKPPTSLWPRESSTRQRSIGHFFQKQRRHSGILLIVAERTSRRRQQHRSTQHMLTNTSPGAENSHTLRHPRSVSARGRYIPNLTRIPLHSTRNVTNAGVSIFRGGGGTWSGGGARGALQSSQCERFWGTRSVSRGLAAYRRSTQSRADLRLGMSVGSGLA